MAHALIRTIDRWRFERPLALLLGAAVAFAGWAVPPALLGARDPLADPALHAVAAVLAGVVIAALAFFALRRPRARVADADAIDPLDEEPEVPVARDRLIRLRRADAHPDAPPREPIRASRDLGEPFMDVGAFMPPPAAPAIPDGDYVEVEAVAPDGVDAADAEAPREAIDTPFDAEVLREAAPIDRPVGPADASPEIAFRHEDHATVAAPPENEDVGPGSLAEPQPAAYAEPASLSALMDRLSAGLERRAGSPPRPPRAHPQLREAINELNRLAARHD